MQGRFRAHSEHCLLVEGRRSKRGDLLQGEPAGRTPCAKKGSFKPSINPAADHETGLAEPKQTQNPPKREPAENRTRGKTNPRRENPAERTRGERTPRREPAPREPAQREPATVTRLRHSAGTARAGLPSRSRPSARWRAAALSAVSRGTVTSNLSSRRQSRSFSRVIIFMKRQTAARGSARIASPARLSAGGG